MSLRSNLPIVRKLDQLVLEGRAQLIATPTAALNTLPTIVAPQVGQVAIITKMICTCYKARDTSPGLAETGQVQGFNLLDEYGNVHQYMPFLSFMRVNALHAPADTPSWHSAVPCAPVEWEPEQPLLVPPKWVLRSSVSGSTSVLDMAGNCWACYGYITDVQSARNLGFEVNDYEMDASPSDSSIRMGFVGAEFTASAVEILAGRTGQSIQIVDMLIRAQPLTHAPTKSLTVRQTDDRVIFKGCNNNPSDFAEWKFSPGIFLKSGQGIEILGDSGIRATVAIMYRFVDDAQVPSNHWWAYREPQLPTPAGGTVGTLSLFTAASSTLSLYYPKLDTTATTPGVGMQHVVNGWAVSGQKDLTVACDQVFFAITTGDAGGYVDPAAGVSGLPTTNKLISPIFNLASHDQCLFMAVDGINVPCGKDTGLVLVDTVGTGQTVTPAAADLDIDEFHCLVWGKTIGTKTTGTSHFSGGLS